MPTQAHRQSATEKLPSGAVALLMSILEAITAGRGVTSIPENTELTTVEAANILNVSRPFLTKLLDERLIPHRLVGKHRRILIDDAMAHKEWIDRERAAILDELTAQARRTIWAMAVHERSPMIATCRRLPRWNASLVKPLKPPLPYGDTKNCTTRI